MNITRRLLPSEQRKRCPENYIFGQTFSDHMFVQDYKSDAGWTDPQVIPYGPFSLAPAASVFHYGQEIFEGLKAYRSDNGEINLFRPDLNAKRFNLSASRMGMPQVDEDKHIEAIKQLVDADRNWVPNEAGSSLYIRPTMIATSPMLGLKASESYKHFIITSPAGSYFSRGLEPVAVKIARVFKRAVKGGIGEAKTGGNYAASMLAANEAAKENYDQVLWLDAIENKYIEEVGAMNICFVYDGKTIVTPTLSGSILNGITRRSVLELAPTLGYDVREERLDIDAILGDIKAGKITEAFGCGTAAVISPIGIIGDAEGENTRLNNNQTGPVSKQLYEALTNIQYGRSTDEFNWVVKV